MSRTNPSSRKQTNGSSRSQGEREDGVQKQVVNRIFLLIVIVISVLVLALVLFDQQSAPQTAPETSSEQEEHRFEDTPALSPPAHCPERV